MQRVLIFCLSGLGDTVMASPAIAALAAERDRFHLTLLTMFPSVQEYLREQNFTDDVRFVDFLHASKTTLWWQVVALRRERFDVSVLPYPHNRFEYNMVAALIGARMRIGFRYQKQRHRNFPWLNHKILDEDPKLHVVEENLRWAAELTGRPLECIPDQMHARISEAHSNKAAQFLHDMGIGADRFLVGIHPSCNPLKNQQRRCWPIAHFRALIEDLAVWYPRMSFVIFEGPQDEQLQSHVHSIHGRVAVARRLPLPVAMGIIQRCKLFISNDSGLLHLAAAAQVPCVAIFGPTNPTWVRPWRTKSKIVSRGLPCSPCFYYSSRPLRCSAKIDYACVRELPLDDVRQAIDQLLDELGADVLLHEKIHNNSHIR
ncbi:MAG: glycosyltransferase family 9 protein [Verrucomicrobiae bacterium]|nr:glycosyltransferase family 9 protein [Verrucomicrobiae bacterium]